MATFGGPDIINEDLLILIDAANPKCFPGTGLTLNNLTNNPNFPSMYITGVTSYGSIGNGVVTLSGDAATNQNGAYLEGNGNLAVTVNDDFSSMGWIYRTTNDTGEIMSYRQTFVRLSFDIQNSLMGFFQRETVSPFTINTTSVSVTNELNRWDFFALTKSGNNYSFYKNGQHLQTNQFIMTETIANSTLYHVGIAWSDDDYRSRGMDGNVGPIMQNTRALSADEVQQNYNAYKNRFNL